MTLNMLWPWLSPCFDFDHDFNFVHGFDFDHDFDLDLNHDFDYDFDHDFND